MFDRVHVDRSTYAAAYPQTVTVTHNHAPVGEHTKLLDEMRKEARKSVLSAIPLQANELKGKVLIEKPAMEFDTRVTIVFELNGARRDWSERYDERLEKTKLVAKVKEDFSRYMCGALLSGMEITTEGLL